MSTSVFKSGYIAIVGRPNVGKSTLLNAFVGEKLSIVTPKPQTTRGRVLGIVTCPASQMIFLDTPGLLTPQYRLQEAMRKQIDRSIREADILLGLVDATDFEGSFDGVFRESLDGTRIPTILAINKIDRVSSEALAEMVGQAEKYSWLEKVISISALYRTNVDELRSALEENLPVGPLLYPADVISQQPERFFVSELIREEVFTQLRQEIPYSTAVKVEEFREGEGAKKTYIQALVFVERESQKGIVIGAKGMTLKSLGQKARAKIEGFLGRPVYLDLWVKVRQNWRKKDADLREFGYLD